jgi:hypothetical protein
VSVTFAKRCACGLTYDAEAWHALPLCGAMRDDVKALELRTCACGSTIAVQVCIVEGCTRPPTWAADDLRDYCDEHATEWLLAEASIERREVAA